MPAPHRGKILTGLAAFWIQSWQHAWLAMAAVSFGVTVWNAWLLPKRAVAHDRMKAKQHLHFRLFTRAACLPLYGTLIVYGLLFSVYLTFAVDLVSSMDAMKSPVDKLFWPLLGIAGLTTVFTGSTVSRYGVRSLLSVSLPLCGLSYAMLALASNNPWVILGSAILFGAASIAPGTGFMVWGIRLFHARPSIGSGTVFFFQSIGVIAGPLLSAGSRPVSEQRRFSSYWPLSRSPCCHFSPGEFSIRRLLNRLKFWSRALNLSDLAGTACRSIAGGKVR